MFTRQKQLLFMGVIGVIMFPLMLTVAGFSQVLPELPRHEVLILQIQAGKTANPKRFNVWVPPTYKLLTQGTQQVCMDTLWYIGQLSGEWFNALAEKRPVYNDDFTKMTVNLRKGVYWSDGVEFTADDIVFTVETQKNHPGMVYSAFFDIFVDKVYKTDDYTVVFELKRPNSRFHVQFVVRWSACYIMPKHIWEKVEDPLAFDFYPPVSLGPYVLKDFDPTGFWHLWERREDWYRTSLGMMYGMPKPRYLLWVHYGPIAKQVMAQAKHELDASQLFSPEGWESLMKRNPYSRSWYKDFPWACFGDPAAPGVILNNDVYPLGIKDVRWALTLTIDIVPTLMAAYSGGARITALPNTPTRPYFKWYYEPMEEWLRDFTLDVDGEPFKPYDPRASLKLVQRCKEKGYSVPTDPGEIREIWGYGWWKYAPEVAEKLLKKHGFRRDKNGKWLLPDGTPWKITILTQPPDIWPLQARLGFVVAEQYRKFGIDARAEASEMCWPIQASGNYDCAITWPVETWGGHPDLYRFLEYWHSDYYTPIGEVAPGRNPTRWKDERMDRIIEEMNMIHPDDPRTIELGIEAMKLMIEEMPSITMVGQNQLVPVDEYYWTNFPTAENPYAYPLPSGGNYRVVFPRLVPTGRK